MHWIPETHHTSHSTNAQRTFEDILLPASHYPTTVPDHAAMRIHVRTTDNAINCFLNIFSEGLGSLFFTLESFGKLQITKKLA